MKIKFNKANAFGAVGLAAAVGLVVYSAYKANKNKKEVKKAIVDEKIDEAMIEAIEEVSDPEFTSSELERHMCTSVLEGYRKAVLNANDLDEMRTLYLKFRTAHKDIVHGGTSGRYFRCKRYLDRLDASTEDEKTGDNTGNLIEMVLEVTKTGVELLK